MELNTDEALRYLGVRGTAPEALRRQAEETARMLTAAVRPRWVYRVFPLEREGDAFHLIGSGVRLTGRTAEAMLAESRQAVLLACTLGTGFDTLLRREQARDMSRAVILDACGGVWVEAGCDAAEDELRGQLPGKFLTDRFSPGYGDLPLSLQTALCAALDAERRLGLHVTESLMLNPVKSVTAVIGVADRPQPARVRGCGSCPMRENCAMRKGGLRCGI